MSTYGPESRWRTKILSTKLSMELERSNTHDCCKETQYLPKAPTLNLTDILKLWLGTVRFYNKSLEFGSSCTQYVKMQLMVPRLGFKLNSFRIWLKRQSCIRRFDMVQSDMVDMLRSLNCAIEVSNCTSLSSLWIECRSSHDLCIEVISSSSCVINPSKTTSVHCVDL